jgi:hypothetical protein
MAPRRDGHEQRLYAFRRTDALRLQWQPDCQRGDRNRPHRTSLFTTTQLNSGAASAGLPIADFKSLDQNTQNYFINTYKSSQLSKDVSAVITGSLTKTGQNKQQVASNVQSSNLPDAVKQIILKMLGVSSASAATAPQSGGFLNTAWSGVKSALGGIASWLGI